MENGNIHEEGWCLPGLKDIRECEHHPSTGQHHGRRLSWSQVPVSGRPIEHSQEIRCRLLFPPLSYCSEIRPHSCVQCSQRNLDSDRLVYHSNGHALDVSRHYGVSSTTLTSNLNFTSPSKGNYAAVNTEVGSSVSLRYQAPSVRFIGHKCRGEAIYRKVLPALL